MSTYTKAKADLERAMRAAGRLEREAIASNRVRPAAITVMQPYAWLIAHAPLWPRGIEGKTLENRGRATSYRGQVLIHVSKRWQQVDQRLDELRALGLVGGRCPTPRLEVMKAQLGCVIARAQLVGCRRVDAHDPHPWGVAGSWGWLLDAIELIDPFPLTGNTGLWFAPPELVMRARPHRRAHLLEGLPGATHVPGLVLDADTGLGSLEVPSLVDAARALMRAGIRDFGQVLHLDGERTTAGEILALAAAEHGDFAGEASLRAAAAKASRRTCLLAPTTCDARPPQLTRCEVPSHG
ncbi:MAG: hypothetical protein KDK70_40110 [Myxococcales bacterium]|nr:hypothetical protein [Myxococcales bacterium]